MRFKIYSDVHKLGPHELKDFEFIYDGDAIFLGDDFDLKNSKKDYINRNISQWRTHVFNILRWGGVLVRGNHEKMKHFPEDFVNYFKLKNSEIQVWIIIDGVLFTHGWKLQKKWEAKEANYFDDNPKGAGSLRRAYVKARNSARELLDVSFSQEEKDYLLQFVKNCQIEEVQSARKENREAQTIRACCFGHTHPKKIIDFYYHGYRFINVPRGYTEVEI